MTSTSPTVPTFPDSSCTTDAHLCGPALYLVQYVQISLVQLRTALDQVIQVFFISAEQRRRITSPDLLVML